MRRLSPLRPVDLPLAPDGGAAGRHIEKYAPHDTLSSLYSVGMDHVAPLVIAGLAVALVGWATWFSLRAIARRAI